MTTGTPLAFADMNGPDLAAGIEVGTLGAGAVVSTPLGERWSVDLSADALSLSHGYKSYGVDYGAQLHLQTLGLTASYFPWAESGFRLRTGLFYDGNHFSLSATLPAGGYTVNGVTYTSQQLSQLTGKIDFRPAAPYLGVGWGNRISAPGWHVTADLGLLYQGSPRVALSGVTSYPTGSPQYNAIFANLDAEGRRIRDDLGHYEWYPVVAVGVSYRF